MITEDPARMPRRIFRDQPYDAVVLAGGEARRLGGADKALLDVGGRPLLSAVLAAVDDAVRVVVVGPRRPTARAVTWCREDPPRGGPVAALAAALPFTAAPYLAVLAVDLPFLTAEAVRLLVRAAAGHDGALLVDAQGRDQPLCAAYARAALARRLGAAPAAGRALRSVVDGLDLVRLPDEGGNAFDCDTWDDLARARRTEADRAR
jgi:molybdopterin-guanine dinucleotide biosynthesis protein A